MVLPATRAEAYAPPRATRAEGRPLRYNRFHDQLLASAGADRRAALWRASSVSSAPLLDMDLGDAPADESSAGASSGGAKAPDAADVLVRDFDLHDEALTAVAWSHCDAWVFASLSYDGRVLLNHGSRVAP